MRKLIDCLIAGYAIRARILFLHADSDSDALSRPTGLTIDRAGRECQVKVKVTATPQVQMVGQLFLF